MYFVKKSTLVPRMFFMIFLLTSISYSPLLAKNCENFFKTSNLLDVKYPLHQIKYALSINSYVPDDMYLFSDPYRLESRIDLNTYLKFYDKVVNEYQYSSLNRNMKLVAFSVDYESSTIPRVTVEEFTSFAKVLYENKETTEVNDATYFYIDPHKRIFSVRLSTGTLSAPSERVMYVETREVLVKGKRTLFIENITGGSSIYIPLILDLFSDNKELFGVKYIAYPIRDELPMYMDSQVLESLLDENVLPFIHCDKKLQDDILQTHINASLPIHMAQEDELRIVKSSAPSLLSKIFKTSSKNTRPSMQQQRIRPFYANTRTHYIYSLAEIRTLETNRAIRYHLLLKYLETYMQDKFFSTLVKPTGWFFNLLAYPFLPSDVSDVEFQNMLGLMFNQDRLSIEEYEKAVEERFGIELHIQKSIAMFIEDMKEKPDHIRLFLFDHVPLEALIRASDTLNEDFATAVVTYLANKLESQFVLDDTFDILLTRADFTSSLNNRRMVLGDDRLGRYILVGENLNRTDIVKIAPNVYLWPEGHKWGLIDGRGTILLTPNYKEIYIVSIGDTFYIKVESFDGKFGLMYINGGMILAANYDSIELTKDGIRVTRDGLTSVMPLR